MNVINLRRRNLIWKEDKLYLKDKLMVSLVQDEVYKHMYYLKWTNGRKSSDFYNLTRARDGAMVQVLEKLKKLGIDPEQDMPVEAL